MSYWVLGKTFSDDHERAIRFVEPLSEDRKLTLGVPTEVKTASEHCDKCNCYHLRRAICKLGSQQRKPMVELKCGHYEAYRCTLCKNCCQCTHIYQFRDNGWWAKCTKTLKWHKCLGPSK